MFRVLIAEDELLVRIGVKNSIPWEQYGMSVCADVPNGKEAWDVYVNDKPDLIITDIKMPVIGGMELIERIREEDKTTKIIILSCLSEFEIVRKALSMGVSDYILKLTMTPDEMQQVIAKVAAEMESSGQPDSPVGNPMQRSERKEKLLKDYMFRGLYTTEQFAALADRLYGWSSGNRLLMCLFEIDRYDALKDRFHDDYGPLTEMNLFNIIDKVVGTYEGVEAVHDQRNRFMLLNSSSYLQRIDQISREIEPLLQHLRQVLSTYFNTTVTFGISIVGSGYAQIKELYKESLMALEMKFVLGEGSTLWYSPELARQFSHIVREALADLERGWRDLDNPLREALSEHVSAFLKADKYDKTDVLNFFLRLMQAPLFVLRLQDDSVWNSYEQVSAKIRDARTMKETTEQFAVYLNQVIRLHAKSPSWSKEVSEAVLYMEKHYREEITLQQLARLVNLSANYFSTVFKKETKCSPIEYLIQYRIGKAKELLLQSENRTYEIAEMVGIPDHSYFSRIFKKITGMNPKNFRIGPDRNGEHSYETHPHS